MRYLDLQHLIQNQYDHGIHIIYMKRPGITLKDNDDVNLDHVQMDGNTLHVFVNLIRQDAYQETISADDERDKLESIVGRFDSLAKEIQELDFDVITDNADDEYLDHLKHLGEILAVAGPTLGFAINDYLDSNPC